ELGPAHAKEVWGYEIEIVPREEFAARLKQARSDNSVMADVERETQAFLDRPNLTLQTERKFVLNSFLVWHVCRELLQEKKAFNFGFDKCMGREVIEMLDTPPCLVLALANDSGYTAYCHTDLTHTCPGVLLRWISSKPTFVCNTHFPYNGIMTVAHCAAPMKMNGVSNESVTVMTHYESDYGAATRIHYTLGQTVTVVIPNLNCTNWQGFRGTIVETPTLQACRSQMNIAMDGDCRTLVREMEGFHAQVVYGDYLKEVGYALKQLKKLEWRNFSENA
ncbi:MAG TPA: sugar isomerase, partial [bacterium]|nr:sugar isomerase [bacterium]